MTLLFQDELTTRILFGRIEREIEEDQLEQTIIDIKYYNEAREKIITKCDLALRNNKNYNR